MKNLKKSFLDNIYLVVFLGLVFVFFYPFIIFGKIPIPADTIVGMYHPWRDVVWDGYKAGVPYKNFLITDPVRQQYVWRKLAFDQFKKGNMPLWNPFSFSGTPLLANFQSAVFYPFNLTFFVLPFNLAWGILVLLQPLLAGIFLYLYLRCIGVSKQGAFLGSVIFSFSGFTISWLEWNTIIHTILWLPLVLLCVEKIFQYFFTEKSKKQCKSRNLLLWPTLFVASLVFSFFAGHLQVFFYSFLFIVLYIYAKLISLKENKIKIILLFSVFYFLFFIITSIQWLPTFQFILLSARDFDQGSWLKPGWFIPWQNLIQFIAPDFFGNPATGNYWGVWNYGEFIGFVGILPLIFAIYALFFGSNKGKIFFGIALILSLIFALPNLLSYLPYQLKIPLLSSSQPTRLICIVDFTLAVLAALGFDQFFKNKNTKQILAILLLFAILILFLWLFVCFPMIFKSSILPENLLISKRNLIFPTIMFVISLIMLSFLQLKQQKQKNTLMLTALFIIIAIDLFRFGWKFTPFVRQEWIFPTTKLIDYLKKNIAFNRMMILDRRIMAPNFSGAYYLQDVAGYDPLYDKGYGLLVAAWERDKGDISPSSFNRILTPTNYESFVADLLGVKYFLSLGPINSNKLSLVMQEGETYLYENKKVIPRAFFAEELIKTINRQDEIEEIFRRQNELSSVAVTSENLTISPQKLANSESVNIAVYDENYIRLNTKTNTERLLILSDNYYPQWQVYLDGHKTRLWQVDFNLRGVVVPKGEHTVEFKIVLI